MMESTSNTINISKLSSGIYIVNSTTQNDKQFSQKLIKN
ncbi:T9SS type A sorting domain-containing protein [Flavobacterium lindanitolerans]|nr:T9SS type A sorting domain-containing protein [Flavobacterium lindanitolerans]